MDKRQRDKKKQSRQGRIDKIGGATTSSEESVDLQKVFKAMWDEMSGKRVRPTKVGLARQEEMTEVYKHELDVKVPIHQCWDETGKPPPCGN